MRRSAAEAAALIDIYDTALKGVDWLTRPSYLVQAPIYFAIYIAGMLTKRRPLHLASAILFLAMNITWILIDANVLGSW